MKPMRAVRTILAVFAFGALSAGSGALAAESAGRLDRARSDVRDLVSLQAGARTFVNYCMNCHSASMMRYNRLRDIGLSEDQIRDNLMFTAEKVGELMHVGMTAKDAKEWFGVAPPDLSLIARTRGTDWLYTYLRVFYRDSSSETGWNNLLFDRVAMPHAMWTLSGHAVLEAREFKTHQEAEAARLQAKVFSVIAEKEAEGARGYVLKSVRVDTPGSLSPAQYDAAVRDLVNFLVWMSEPAQLERKRAGIVVLLCLGVLLVLTWLLYKEYWKDVH